MVLDIKKEWQMDNLFNLLKDGAGTLAHMIGGPIAGKVADTALGYISDTLGIESKNPDDIVEFLKNNPNALIQLKELNTKLELKNIELLETEMKYNSKNIQAVNMTMQAESRSDHFLQYAWRPIFGLVGAGVFGVIGIAIAVVFVYSSLYQDATALGAIRDIVDSSSVLFGCIAAVCGVTSYSRGAEKKQKNKKPGDDSGFLNTLLSKVK